MKVLKYKDSNGEYQIITPIVIDNSEALARVDTEENRAIEAEKDLESKIDDETKRAKSAESNLEEKLDDINDIFSSGKEGQTLTKTKDGVEWSDLNIENGSEEYSIQQINCNAVGYNSSAFGNETYAIGINSFAEGSKSQANGKNSHAEGYSSHSVGGSSHAEGNETVAEGSASHSEGYNTASKGTYSHAEGYYTKANGAYSHAEGGTTLANNFCEHAQGQFNKSNKTSDSFGNAGNTLHSVGIGERQGKEKNAFEIMQNGDAYFYGLGGYDGTNPSSAQPIASVVKPNLDIHLKITEENNGLKIEHGDNMDWLRQMYDNNPIDEKCFVRIYDERTRHIVIPNKIWSPEQGDYWIDFIVSYFDEGYGYLVNTCFEDRNGLVDYFVYKFAIYNNQISADNDSLVTSNTIYNALQKKLDVPSNTGSNGQVLTKTSTGLEWSDAKGGDDVEWDDCTLTIDNIHGNPTVKSFVCSFDGTIPKHPRLFVTDGRNGWGVFTNFTWSTYSKMDQDITVLEVDVPLDNKLIHITISIDYGMYTDCNVFLRKYANSLFDTLTQTQYAVNQNKDKVTIFKVTLTSDYQLRINYNAFDDGEVHLICENTASSDITVTIPNAVDSVPIKTNVDSFTIPAGSFGEINIIRGFDTFYIRAV